MKLFLSGILLTFLFVFSTAAQESKPTVAPASAAETLLRVAAQDGKTFDLKAADLAKLPRREVRAKIHHGDAEAMFSGVDLREVLKLAGVKFGEEGKRANLTSYLLVEAADNYRAIFAMTELEPDFNDKIVLLADSRDGKPLSKEEGKVRLVVPDEKKQARWVRQVVKLSVESVSSKAGSKTESNKIGDEDAIREVIFTTLLTQRASTGRRDLNAYYLAVDGAKDPSDDLLKKFAGYPIPVKKSSESFMSQTDGDVILNAVTKEQGILFSISKIDWINEDVVKANADSYTGSLGGNGCLYILKRENGKWKIATAENCFVS